LLGNEADDIEDKSCDINDNCDGDRNCDENKNTESAIDGGCRDGMEEVDDGGKTNTGGMLIQPGNGMRGSTFNDSSISITLLRLYSRSINLDGFEIAGVGSLTYLPLT
jgi:hypothetical protein